MSYTRRHSLIDIQKCLEFQEEELRSLLQQCKVRLRQLHNYRDNEKITDGQMDELLNKQDAIKIFTLRLYDIEWRPKNTCLYYKEPIYTPTKLKRFSSTPSISEIPTPSSVSGYSTPSTTIRSETSVINNIRTQMETQSGYSTPRSDFSGTTIRSESSVIAELRKQMHELLE